MFDQLGISPSKPYVSKRSEVQQNPDKFISRRNLLRAFPVLLVVGWFLWAPITWMGLANDGKIFEL
jgi:hypothetical protein